VFSLMVYTVVHPLVVPRCEVAVYSCAPCSPALPTDEAALEWIVRLLVACHKGKCLNWTRIFTED
jgi:hypothetical protein